MIIFRNLQKILSRLSLFKKNFVIFTIAHAWTILILVYVIAPSNFLNVSIISQENYISPFLLIFTVIFIMRYE